MPALTVMVGMPVAPPDRRLLQFVAEVRDGGQRHRLTAAGLQLQVAQRLDRTPLLFSGTADDVDQIDVVPDLR